MTEGTIDARIRQAGDQLMMFAERWSGTAVSPSAMIRESRYGHGRYVWCGFEDANKALCSAADDALRAVAVNMKNAGIDSPMEKLAIYMWSVHWGTALGPQLMTVRCLMSAKYMRDFRSEDEMLRENAREELVRRKILKKSNRR